MKTIKIVVPFLLILLLQACESRLEQKNKEFAILEQGVLSGNVEWVEENAQRYLDLNTIGTETDIDYGDDQYWASRQRDNFVISLTAAYFETDDQKVKDSVIALLQACTFCGHRLIGIGREKWQESFTILELAALTQAVAEVDDDIYFDLSDRQFVKDELCSAVRADELPYTAFLIGVADFDVGLLRCVSSDDGFHAYTGAADEYCPMSLRRVSGINMGNKIAARNAAWLNRLDQTDFENLDDDEFKSKFAGSFAGLPDLDGVQSMNDLIDKYNRWAFGGDCTTDNLFNGSLVGKGNYGEGGAKVPDGW